MAKIYLTYTHADIDLVKKLTHELIQKGHEVFMDDSVINIGQDWRKALLNALKSADGVLALITENSLKSQYVVSEIGTARAFIDESSNKKFLIPVIYGDIPIPNFIQDLLCVRANESNLSDVVTKIDVSISAFYGRKEAVEEKELKARQLIETKAADYIKDATTALEVRERHNKHVGYTCYVAGFIALAASVYIGATSFNTLVSLQDTIEKYPNQIWAIYISAIVKGAVGIGLLLALSKYTFTLGKSFMHESLKNADRIHAISFGEFYLKAFGDKIETPNDIKDVFQHWNIEKATAFSTLDSNTYDPGFTDKLLETIKELAGKTQSGKKNN